MTKASEQSVFDKLKESVTSAPILISSDSTKPFCIEADSSALLQAPSFPRCPQKMRNGTQSCSSPSRYLQSNATTRSMTMRCLLSSGLCRSGGTLSKALNTPARYGWTTRTSSISWQPNNSTSNRRAGLSTSPNSSSHSVTDLGSQWVNRTHSLAGQTTELVLTTTPT